MLDTSRSPEPAATADDGAAPATAEIETRKGKLVLALGALGVAYGDIGTSPLYAIKECFTGSHAMPVMRANILGVLSLVLWSLLLVIVIKYLTTVMRADNHGEGGIMALLALITGGGRAPGGGVGRPVAVVLALVGTSLLMSDGMITPAISVLGAVEGLEVATHVFKPFIVPATLVAILVGLLFQRRGTAGVAAIFGPAMGVWFVAIAALGLLWIVRHPTILAAANPVHAARFFVDHGWHGFLILGPVVLCLTGAEALYADMGHFGAGPIRLAWYAVVYPSLMLNYLGQGAVLLDVERENELGISLFGAGDLPAAAGAFARGAAGVANPFYAMAPAGTLYPLVGIATVAAVIASQALISGGFSLAQQGVQLGYCPRLTIVHTSHQQKGQIYVPEINWLLMLACCTLVLAFRSSSGLAAAYGAAATGTMTMTSILIFIVMRERWKVATWKAALLMGMFLFIDSAFLLANLTKVTQGGWVPLLIGGALFALQTSWKRGRAALAAELRKSFLPVPDLLSSLAKEAPARVKGTAVFMTSNQDMVPPVLLHHLHHNKVLHEQVVLLYIVTESVPEVRQDERVEVRDLGQGIFQVVGRYGFMQTPNVPDLLRSCRRKKLKVTLGETSYYLGRESLLTSGRSGMPRWRKAIFAFLSRNARPATAFFGIPPNRVVEMGMQIEV